MTLIIPQYPHLEPAIEYAVKQLRKEFDNCQSPTEAIILFKQNPWFQKALPEEFKEWIQDLKDSTDKDSHWVIDRYVSSLSEPGDYSSAEEEVDCLGVVRELGKNYHITTHELITLQEKI